MLMNPQNLLQPVAQLRERVAAAAARAGRNVDSVTILTVSKGHPAATVRAAIAAGLTQFGESYLQEALPKQSELAGDPGFAACTGLVWHFIGRLQSNKTRPVAEHFDWVHAIDRLKVAERLAEQRPYHAPPLNVCLQVNIAGEASKGGIAPAEVPELARSVAALPRLKLRGLMCLPPEEDDPARQRVWFARLRELQESLRAEGLPLDTLSMGMSDDFEAAILEGATIVRIGTALLGPRDSSG
jgi:pyridoxal phosphate enzyme (YggS family)